MERRRNKVFKSFDFYEDQISEVSKIAKQRESKRNKSEKGKKVTTTEVIREAVDKGLDVIKNEE